jgi:hypothetical protein
MKNSANKDSVLSEPIKDDVLLMFYPSKVSMDGMAQPA